MAKILICNLALEGHLNPTLPLAQELVRRGEEVTFCAPFEAEESVRATGASFLGYESTLAKLVASSNPMMRGDISQVPLGLFGEAEAVVPQLLEPARRLGPDIIAYESACLAARMLAELLPVPALRLCATYAVNERFSFTTATQQPPGVGFNFTPETRETIRARGQALAARFGVRPIGFPAMLTEPAARSVVFLPRAFQPESHLFDERFVFVGPSISARLPHREFPLEELDRPGAPILLVSLGTIFNAWPAFFDMCFDAFGGGPFRVVLAIGDKVDPSVIARAPHNFIARPHVPQLEVLARAKAFVTHGGTNSVMEAMYFGVPVVVVPQRLDQPLTARRVSELGLGISLEREATTAEKLRDAVARVTTEASFAEGVAKMQGEVRGAGGYARAADAVIDFAARAARR